MQLAIACGRLKVELPPWFGSRPQTKKNNKRGPGPPERGGGAL